MKTEKPVIALLLFFLMLGVAGCKYPKEYKQVKAGDKFTMMVPPWVKEDKNLKPGAEFQYANRFRNFYTIGTSETKDSSKTIASLMTANLAILSKSMTKSKVDDSVDVTVNGLKGVRVEFSGKMNDEAIYFSEEEIEGKKGFYHLSVWTRTADRKLKFKNDIDSVLNSFKEQ